MMVIMLVLAFSMVANGVSDATPAEVTIHSSDHVNCGGTIISDNWIITAAHCVNSLDADSVQVDINVQESTNTLDSGVTFEADLIKRRYGVALIRTKYPLPRGNIVLLAEEDDNYEAQICQSIGFGPKIDGDIISPEQCRSFPNERVEELMDMSVCFQPRTNGAGTCSDDHYALICDGKLAGVSSSRNRGCPTRFTHISRLLTWIRSVIENK